MAASAQHIKTNPRMSNGISSRIKANNLATVGGTEVMASCLPSVFFSFSRSSSLLVDIVPSLISAMVFSFWSSTISSSSSTRVSVIIVILSLQFFDYELLVVLWLGNNDCYFFLIFLWVFE